MFRPIEKEYYIEERLRELHAQELIRIADEPTLIERLALLALSILRLALDGLGHTLVYVGARAVRLARWLNRAEQNQHEASLRARPRLGYE